VIAEQLPGVEKYDQGTGSEKLFAKLQAMQVPRWEEMMVLGSRRLPSAVCCR
jgi:hypothetical protein